MLVAHDHNVNNVPSSKLLEGPMVTSLIYEVRSCEVTFTIRTPTPNKREFTSLTGTARKKLLKFLPSKLLRC